MRTFLFIYAVIIIVSLFSCDRCKYLDCVIDKYTGNFRIVSAETGDDLVFGKHAVYNKDHIKFFSLKGTDTTFFNCQVTTAAGFTNYDGALYVNFYPLTEVAYIRLSEYDIDTLDISYKTIRTECCGTITEITNFRYNNMVDLPASSQTQIIKK